MVFLLLVSLAAGISGGELSAASRDDRLRTLSANEKMVARFQKELTGASDEGKQRSLRTKIASLEQQNKALRMQLEPAQAAPPAAKSFEDLRGLDWERLPLSEKQRFIYTAIGGLERQGVFITRSPQEYLEAMEKVLRAEPTLASEYLDNLFVFCVYDGEPQTRDAIRRIRDEAASTLEE